MYVGLNFSSTAVIPNSIVLSFSLYVQSGTYDGILPLRKANGGPGVLKISRLLCAVMIFVATVLSLCRGIFEDVVG